VLKEFRKFLLKNRITPKWVIFLLDLAICIVSFLYASYLLADFKIFSLDYWSLFNGIIIITIAASTSFFLFKTYEGIIRFSEIHETMRALSAVFCSLLLMLLLNGILLLSKGTLIIHNSVLFGYFFCASFLICGYRMLVKSLYQEDEEADVISANVIIYGAAIKGSFLQKTLEGISNKQYRVVAFIDDNEMLVGKTIDNVRIYSISQLPSLLKPFRVKYLFFSQHDVDVDLKVKIAEECMKYNVKLMNIPPFERWVQGNLNLNQLSDVKIEDLLGRPAIELCANNVINFISGKNVLITGAAGSIGSELARQIADMAPASLIICDQVETGLHNLEYELQQKYYLGNKLKPYLGDVKDVAAMDQLFYTYRPEIVFHAAAYKHVPVMENHPSQAIRNNVLGTKVLADLSEVYGVERFLFISTDKAINPTNIMGASKRLSEMYCHSLHHSSNDLLGIIDPQVYRISPFVSKTKFITTRFGNVLASNGSVIPRFREQIANGGPVTVTHPEIIRYFMTIQEACSLVLEAITMGNGGEIFMFDMGEPVKILDLAKKMIKLAGYEPDKDIAIKFTGLRPGEKLYEELLNAAEKVIPTHHKKILIAKVQESNNDNVLEEILKLIDLANDSKDEDVVKQMQLMLPEYISNNPVYQLYDNESFLQRTVAISH
jgi:FlaA1/EpsC-like NDP-sugar epimerase